LKTFFCLDPYACEHINMNITTETEIVHLPDPVTIYNDSEFDNESLRIELKIENQRKIFLLFGEIERRKGIYQVLEAVSLLPDTVCRSICLLLAGPISSHESATILAQIGQLRNTSKIQIVVVNKFISDREIKPYFDISYAVLLPYLKHAGMSAILVRAAGAQKPVLASEYGVLGQLVKVHNLGLTVKSESAYEIADAIKQLLNEKIYKNALDLKKASAFAQENTGERFAKTIFDNVEL